MAIGSIIGLVGGGLLSGLGGLFGGSAADKARKRLLAAANLPGVDVGGLTGESLSNMLRYIPQASAVSQAAGAANAQQLATMLESALPGYASGVGALMGRTRDYMAGVLPEDVTKSVMRATAGTALGTGLGLGTPMHRSLTWRDLGKTSEEGVRYGMQTMMQIPRAMPWAQPMDVSQLAGLTPQQLVQLREQERMAQQQLLAQAAGMPGQTAVWGNALGQLGGIGIGYGLQSLLQPRFPTYTPMWNYALSFRP